MPPRGDLFLLELVFLDLYLLFVLFLSSFLLLNGLRIIQILSHSSQSLGQFISICFQLSPKHVDSLRDVTLNVNLQLSLLIYLCIISGLFPDQGSLNLYVSHGRVDF